MTGRFSTRSAAGSVADACPKCGALPGFIHNDGCLLEPCGGCGFQYVACECDPDEQGKYPRVRWEGQWPGVAECVEFGWYVRPTKRGWKNCGPDEPGAQEAVGRLRVDAVWDPAKGRFFRKVDRPDLVS